ncbi:MAG: VRR-NUC domain-containing protein [Gammaproteobacteria bacterium]|nr:VRR-NUC domain-containing protein [Gammaproteobacteria bacterium]MBU1488620.1 VRR-NUC domain-containing protein [Gammaproteobacteria bacterium]MBU2064745.1 VRR-NUC domain-containing protein [Gammaproteobacteria bacterium]MBU2137964.1 VRR-NUC domain-containing protein [Gammaproteobacteria bacterium]MBU2215104.1 VRR-NUC domain-containing protein [Gammaproteobacteria bacterium]
MHPTLDPAFYYLANFQKALAWLTGHHADLLAADEQAFMTAFQTLPVVSQALLVRLIMRKGPHFRLSKLQYPEIGCCTAAAEPLLAAGWLSTQTPLEIETLCKLLRKEEVLANFAEQLDSTRASKSQALAMLVEQYPEPRPFADWCPDANEQVLSLTIEALCERLRLMFFGNLRQDWSEFILADLGILRYEPVAFSQGTRALACRQDVEDYLYLQRCREAFETGQPLDSVLDALAACQTSSTYVAERRAKLLFRVGQQLEREPRLEAALAVYQACGYAAARPRQVRVLERAGHYREAYTLACTLLAAPHNEAEVQALQPAITRLQRQLGLSAATRRRRNEAENRIDLSLPRHENCRVEFAVQAHLDEPLAPAHYVENSLICSLFGLLCWPAIFAPLPGAFFHPFQSGPADLLSADFHSRRAALFDSCLAQLDSDAYQHSIRQTYTEKFATQSPFVYWGALSENLLDQALLCIPAEHLRAWFRRLLTDIAANRSGMPDLIQFYPAQRRYRMIEVKGPGDRLQDNQRRWLAFCAEHGMPVDVCYVQWAAGAEQAEA